MAQSGSTPSSPLFSQIESLYPLACVLTDADQARRLLLRVAERAAECPEDERPDHRPSWLLRLFLQERDQSEEAFGGDVGEDATDTLREDVARQRARDVIPIALASCTAEERFLVALDLFGELDGDQFPELATALGLTQADGRDLRSEAWDTLRRHLNDALSDAERTFLDDAVSDETLREIVREVLSDRLPTMPSSFRARLRSTLEDAARTQTPAPRSADARETRDDGVTSWPRVRTVLVGLIAIALVAAGGIGISYWSGSPSSSQVSPSRPTLSAFSEQHLPAVELALETQRPAEIQAFVQTTWNRQVTLPSVSDGALRGVGRLRLGPNADLPVFLFDDASGTGRIAVFAYTYALVDRLDQDVRLDRDHRDALARDRQFVTVQDSANSGLLWRHEDDIFVAVAPSLDPETLRNRIQL